jgi:hypothetical protein
MLKPISAASLLVLCSVGSSWASSGDAWAEFAAEVETACLAATAEIVPKGTAVVDPFGSESYGLAVVTGATPSGPPVSIICVFDKASKAVEIGGELPAFTVQDGQ